MAITPRSIASRVYGVYADFRNDKSGCRDMKCSGENLAAKLIFSDRVIRVGWDGSVRVNPIEDEKEAL